MIKAFGRLAEIPLLSCVKEWLLKQQNAIELAISEQKELAAQQMEDEIQHHHSQKSTKEEIKNAIREAMIVQTDFVDEFLAIKRRNKELSAATAFITCKVQKQHHFDVNARLK